MTVSNAESAPQDRSGRGYIVGTVVLVILNGLFAILAAPPGNAETKAYFIGQVTGSAVVIALIAAGIFALARAFNKGKPRSRSAAITFWIVFVWFILMVGNFFNRAGARAAAARTRDTITNEQRQGLEIGGDSIRHQTLGFVLPNPGAGFVRSSEAEQKMIEKMGARRDMMVWVFADTAQGKVLSIQATTFPDLNEEMFRKFAAGMRKAGVSATVLVDTTTWADNHRDYRLGLRFPNGVISMSRCVPQLRKGGELVICAQMIGPDTTGLDRVPNALAATQ